MEEEGVNISPLTLSDPWNPEKEAEIIPFLQADVAQRLLGVHHDLRSDWGDQMALLQKRTQAAVTTMRRHGGSSDGVSTTLNFVLRRRALFALKFAPCLEADVKAIEQPARKLGLHAQRLASTVSTPLTEMDPAQGGLGYLSWWDEIHLDQLTYLLWKLAEDDKAGQVLRAAIWRLRRNAGGPPNPLDGRSCASLTQGTNHEWLGRLVSWMRSRDLHIQDLYSHPSPTHQLLRQGPDLGDTGEHGEDGGASDQAAVALDLVDGYDWIVATGERDVILDPALSHTHVTATGLLDDQYVWTWLLQAKAKAEEWLDLVKASIEQDPSFHTSQLPVRRHSIVAWMDDDTVRLGRVITRTVEEVEVLPLTQEPVRARRMCTRSAGARYHSGAEPPIWISRNLLSTTPASSPDRWRDLLDSEQMEAFLRSDWTPEEWRKLGEAQPSSPIQLLPTSTPPALTPLAGTLTQPLPEENGPNDNAAPAAPLSLLRQKLAQISQRERTRREPARLMHPTEPTVNHSYSDGSLRWVGSELRASWAVITNDPVCFAAGPLSESDKLGGRIPGHLSHTTISRAELMGLLISMMDGSVAKGGNGIDCNHVDRKGTLDTLARLGDIGSREFLNLENRDLWEVVRIWSKHLGNRFSAVKVDAHVERKLRRRDRHEWGNHYADAHAEVCI